MKKFIIIIALALLQCACATSQGVSAGNPSMLSFDAISAEITVGYENLEEQHDPSRSVAMNLE
jgi:hypothetical protein